MGRCGTPAYIAPEILKNIPYDGIKADIWSSGVVLYAMIYGNFPFKAETVDELESLIVTGNFTLPKEVTSEAQRLLSRIMNINPDLRPSIPEILEDPWMANVNEECKIYI